MTRIAGGVLGAAALCVLMSVGATASTSTWTVTPGGLAGSSGPVLVTVVETEMQVGCQSVSGSGLAVAGADNPNPIAGIAAADVTFSDCSGPFNAVVELIPNGAWTLHASAYDAAAGVSTGRIEGLDIDVLGPACNATLTGYVDVTYDNATDTVTLLPNPTVEISYVDPENDCLGFIEQGQHLMPEASFVLSPGQDIRSP